MTKRILVVDDDKGILDAVEEVLRYLDYDVKTLTSAEAIFKNIEEYKPDLILIDYLLAGINGGKYCHQVKKNPFTCEILIIIMSAYPKVFFSLGNYSSDMFISKPFNLAELAESIHTCLHKNYQLV